MKDFVRKIIEIISFISKFTSDILFSKLFCEVQIMIYEYEIFYTYTEENIENNSLERITNKIFLKGKSKRNIEAKAYISISQLHGCDINSIVIDDMLYFDEYGDD